MHLLRSRMRLIRFVSHNEPLANPFTEPLSVCPMDTYFPSHTPHLNLAATCPETQALGPGLRTALWVQGCPFRCQGCIAPDWLPLKLATLVSPAELAERILASPVTGLTLSGGEPMLQADALAELVALVRSRRSIDVICFTGFHFEQLLSRPAPMRLLAQLDLLIDGPYLPELNDDLGLRGSSNQVFHHLTDRLAGYDFASLPRKLEVFLSDGQAFLVGLPPNSFSQAFNSALSQVRSYVRA